MATVFVPLQLRQYTGGTAELTVSGGTVRELVESLRGEHAELVDQLVDGDRLRSNLAVSVDGEMRPMGLLEQVEADSEVHFVAALAGG